MNSEIFTRILFSRNFADAEFHENKTLTKWQNHSVIQYSYRIIKQSREMLLLTWADPKGEGVPYLPGKSQVAIGFLRNYAMDHPRARGSLGFILLLKGGLYNRLLKTG